MAAQEIITERRGQALVLTFNRPESANGLTFDLANQLCTILKNVTTDRGVRAVMLRGAGGVFMDGLDRNFMANEMSKVEEYANALIQPYHNAIRELQSMDKPVLAAVEGMVVGPGLSFMLASDLVIAARNTKFRSGFTEYGLTPDGGASYFLSRKIGLSRATALIMCNEEIDVDEARQLHLVNRVADQATFQEESLKWLDELATGPTRALGAVKKLANFAFENDLNKHLGLEHAYFGHSFRSFDFREAVKAYREKRAAKFTGI